MAANGHIYTVEFRIFSEVLDPAVITEELELKPCQIRPNGSLRSDGKKWIGMWAFDGTEGTGRMEWPSLEDGLAHVLGKLWPLKEKIATYRANSELMWWCGHFQSSFDGGPKLSPSLLSSLGEFGVALYIDNYFRELL